MSTSVGRLLTDWRPRPSNDTHPTPLAGPCTGMNIALLAITDEEIAAIGRPITVSARKARALLVAGRNRRAASCRACGRCPGSQTAFTLPIPD